jgi:hypothetical protein
VPGPPRSAACACSSRTQAGTGSRSARARTDSRSVRGRWRRRPSDDHAARRHLRGGAAAPPAARGERDGDAARDLRRSGELLDRSRGRRRQGAPAEAHAGGASRLPASGSRPSCAGEDVEIDGSSSSMRRWTTSTLDRHPQAAGRRRRHGAATIEIGASRRPTASASPSAPTSSGCRTHRARAQAGRARGPGPSTRSRLGCTSRSPSRTATRAPRGDPRPRRDARALLRLRGEAGSASAAPSTRQYQQAVETMEAVYRSSARRRRAHGRRQLPARSSSIRAKRARTS